MRIDVKKVLFAGVEERKSSFFKAAQELGLIDFKDLFSKTYASEETSAYLKALKVLRGLVPLKQTEPEEAELFSSADSLVKEILTHKQKQDKLEETERVLLLEEARLAPLGDYDEEDLRRIEKASKLQAQFFCGKEGKNLDSTEYKELIYLSSEEALDYFVAFTAQPKSYRGLIEIKVERPLHKVREELHQVKLERKKNKLKLNTYAAFSDYLHKAFYDKLSRCDLDAAVKSTQKPLEGLFVAEGWIPVHKVEVIQALSERFGVFMEEVALEPDEVAPTYLENQGMGKIGEDVIDIYDTPSNTDKDPSLWVVLAFGLFFAFIVGDGGYGSIYLGLCLWLKYKNPDLQGFKKRVLNLALFLSVMCILWGFFANSFFGLSLSIDNPLRKHSPITLLAEKKGDWALAHPEVAFAQHPPLKPAVSGKELMRNNPELLTTYVDNVLLELALFIGVVHVILGMLRYCRRNWAFFGWILFIIGAYLYLPTYLGVPSLLNYVVGIDWAKGGEVGLALIYLGFPLAILLAVIKNKWLGLVEAMTVVTIFADILSYLRLYALGLAGGIMAGVINDAWLNLPIALGVLVVIAAHAVNMGLGIMGGVVHGLRLNFLEWYHYSFEGNGKKFKPLSLSKME